MKLRKYIADSIALEKIVGFYDTFRTSYNCAFLAMGESPERLSCQVRFARLFARCPLTVPKLHSSEHLCLPWFLEKLVLFSDASYLLSLANQ